EWHHLRQQCTRWGARGHLRSSRWVAGALWPDRAGLARPEPVSAARTEAPRSPVEDGQWLMMNGTRGFVHRGITLPRAPTRLRRRVITPCALHPKSVTHVLGPKCHLCPHSFSGRCTRRAWPVFAAYVAATKYHCQATSGAGDR